MRNRKKEESTIKNTDTSLAHDNRTQQDEGKDDENTPGLMDDNSDDEGGRTIVGAKVEERRVGRSANVVDGCVWSMNMTTEYARNA